METVSGQMERDFQADGKRFPGGGKRFPGGGKVTFPVWPTWAATVSGPSWGNEKEMVVVSDCESWGYS